MAGLLCLLALAGCPQQNGPQAAPPKNATAPTAQGNPEAGTAASGAQSGQATAAGQNASQPGAASPEAVTQLIANVETAYQAGVNSYRAGEINGARQNFDRAVDLMLTSPLDVRTTPALSDEFDKIIEGINTLETAALQQGSGITQQVEISPAEEANDVTFPVDPNLRARAEAEIKTTQSDLPLVINDPVASFISYFTNNRDGRAHLARSLEREGRYRDMIERIFREEGVPPELIYQAVAESGFQPLAVNGHSGAGGMWQFMPGTGANYGLVRNGFVDERFDPELATRAYARYMKYIYNQLGDWYLVMAGYDWGEGAVQKAVGKTGYADFWELYRRNNLPQETKNYVPIILAATIIAKNPQQYGFSDLHPLPALAFEDVTTTEEISLRLVADLTGAQLDEIQTLNPGLLRLATPPGMSYPLHLPPGTKDLFTTRLALIPDDHRQSWRYHTVAAGESLADIAKTYHSDAEQIAAANHISGDQLEEGEGVVVPVAAVVSSVPSLARVTQRYTTRRGDTVIRVADRFGVSPAQIRSWNHLSSNTLPAGRVLRVSSPSFSHAAAKSTRHRGRHGKTSSGGEEPTEKAAVAGKTAGHGAAKSGKAGAKSATRAKGSRAGRGTASRSAGTRSAGTRSAGAKSSGAKSTGAKSSASKSKKKRHQG
jgi:membrane-bound lytic murein transglycosylase D